MGYHYKIRLGIAVIELFNPLSDPTANTLTYTISAENATIDLPGEFGQSILAVDTSTTYTGQFIDIDNFGAVD